MAGIRYWGKTGKNETYMHIHVMVYILKFCKLDKNNLSQMLSETLKTCGHCSASSTQNTSNTETHCQAGCTNSQPNLQGKHFICWKKTEGLTKTPWKYLEAWWTELRWCKNWGEVPLCSWLRQVQLEWCSVWNIVVLGRMEKIWTNKLSIFSFHQVVGSFGRQMIWISRKLEDNWVISRNPLPTLEWLSGHLTWGHWRFSQWCNLCR